MSSLPKVLHEAASRSASEIIIESGQPPMIRTSAGAVTIGETLTQSDLFDALAQILAPEQQAELAVGNVVEFNLDVDNGRWTMISEPSTDGIVVRGRLRGSSISVEMGRPLDLPPLEPVEPERSDRAPRAPNPMFKRPTRRTRADLGVGLGEAPAHDTGKQDAMERETQTMPPPDGMHIDESVIAPLVDHAAPRLGVEHAAPRLGVDHADSRLGVDHAAPRLGVDHAASRLGVDHADSRLGVDHADPDDPVQRVVEAEPDFELRTPTGEQPANLVDAHEPEPGFEAHAEPANDPGDAAAVGDLLPVRVRPPDRPRKTPEPIAAVAPGPATASEAFELYGKSIQPGTLCIVQGQGHGEELAQHVDDGLFVVIDDPSPDGDLRLAADSPPGSTFVMRLEDPSACLGWMLRRLEEGARVVVETRALTLDGARRTLLGIDSGPRAERWLDAHAVCWLADSANGWMMKTTD